MSTNQRIDYVEFPAADFDVFENFYSGAFGWQFTDCGPQYRSFRDGNMEGGIYKSDLKSSTETGAALVVIYAENLEASLENVVANGGTICNAIITFPGGRRFQFLDPHGNELGVWSDK